jgi:hypothetical protein
MQASQTTVVRILCQILLFVISLWATREPLVNRYKSFELKIAERDNSTCETT